MTDQLQFEVGYQREKKNSYLLENLNGRNTQNTNFKIHS